MLSRKSHRTEQTRPFELLRWGTLGLAVVVGLEIKLPSAYGSDELDELAQHTKMPHALRYQHGYSDFTDPLGRFLDLLAAGAFADAKLLKPDACSAWLATRETSPLTGKVLIWDTEVSLDVICGYSPLPRQRPEDVGPGHNHSAIP